MRFIALTIAVTLLTGATAFASGNLEAQVRSNEERITQLENRLGELYYQLETGQSSNTRTTGQVTDPIIGHWDCSNGAFRTEIYFESNGRMQQTDIILGSTKSANWIRRNKEEIALVGGNTFRLESHSQDQFTVTETNSRSQWECTRLED